MTSTLKIDTIEPEGATTTLNVGESGQDTVIAGAGLKSNILKNLGGGYPITALTSSGTWTCPTGVTSVDILVVAGGGGGAASDTTGQSGGGGGAGGVVHNSSYTVVPDVVYDITVGVGGQPGNTGARDGANGTNSVFNVNAEGSQSAMTAVGGGGGSQYNGIAGGSAGGTGRDSSTGASATQGDSGGGTGYGNDGGYGGSNAASSGGGGAGAVGGNSDGTDPGAGGAGREFSNFSAYGVAGFFAGGGGGGSGDSSAGGAGGSGGGGAGGSEAAGNRATANTGGGGGGSGFAGAGGPGANGIVLIRELSTDPQKLFESDGSGNLSNVNSGFGSPTVLIQSQSASASASIDFTSGIDSTYKEYLFRFIDIQPATDSQNFTFQVNASGESGYNETMTTTTFWSYRWIDGTAYVLAYRPQMDQAQGTAYQALTEGSGGASDESGAGELHLFNPSSTTYIKNFYARFNWFYYGDASMEMFTGGYINTTAAIDEISFKFVSGNITAGTIKMYGIK